MQKMGKIAPGWLARSLENARRYEAENPVWVALLQSNWSKTK